MSAAELAMTVTPLRERQKLATQTLVLDAVGRCLEDTSLSELSFARVAQEAGIAERTVYRHFPNKDALLEAFWRRHKADIGQEAFPDTAAALAAFPPRAFPLFDREAQMMRGAVLSPQGRALTLRANADRQAAIRRAVRDGAGDLSEPELTRLCAVVQLLHSATAWLTMRDYWGLSGEEAGRASRDAIETLLAAARQRTTSNALGDAP